jgi:23S rRNA (guanosine2251-2'-O)-methyltransferase
MLSIVIMLCYAITKELPMSLTLVLDNLRSAHNVGSILRTADAAGVIQVICVGTTPHPALLSDQRPGHVAARNTREIAKTALGAEESVSISYEPDLRATLKTLRDAGTTIVALEQDDNSTNLFDYKSAGPIALILGNEVDGVDLDALEDNDIFLEIPMKGTKESLNVAVAAGIAIYQLSR